MLFYILYTSVFPNMKSMNTVMFRLFISAVVDSASGDNNYIGVFPDVKIVIY